MNATGDDGDSSEELLALYAHFQQATELTNANYDDILMTMVENFLISPKEKVLSLFQPAFSCTPGVVVAAKRRITKEN